MFGKIHFFNIHPFFIDLFQMKKLFQVRKKVNPISQSSGGEIISGAF